MALSDSADGIGTLAGLHGTITTESERGKTIPRRSFDANLARTTALALTAITSAVAAWVTSGAWGTAFLAVSAGAIFTIWTGREPSGRKAAARGALVAGALLSLIAIAALLRWLPEWLTWASLAGFAIVWIEYLVGLAQPDARPT